MSEWKSHIKDKLKVAICQLTSIDDVDVNFETIDKLIKSIDQVDLVCFPENSIYMRTKEKAHIPGLHLTDPVFHKLANISKSKNCFLHLGGVPLKFEGKLKNSSVLINPSGEVKISYDKIHLFDIQLEGQEPVRESDMYHGGVTPEIIEIADWKIGQTICYDLRFSELFNYYAQRSVDMILVPSSFLVKTGMAHWEVLMRARAIESQAYIVAAAQAGTHHGKSGGQRETYGHSLAVDPWGQIVAEAKSMGPEVLVVELSKEKIAQVRRQIPMRDHRRLVKVIS